MDTRANGAIEVVGEPSDTVFSGLERGRSIVGWGQHFCRARETVAGRPTLSPPPRHAWLELSHLSHVSAARVTARMPIVIGFVTRVTPVTGGFGGRPTSDRAVAVHVAPACGGGGADGCQQRRAGSDYRALQSQVRELQRLLGKKTLEAEILKEALEHATGSKKQLRLPPSPPKDGSR